MHSWLQVERFANKLTSLRSQRQHLAEENVRHAGYVLAATQSVRHMSNVVESADPAFAAANADRARLAKAAAAAAEAESAGVDPSKFKRRGSKKTLMSAAGARAGHGHNHAAMKGKGSRKYVTSLFVRGLLLLLLLLLVVVVVVGRVDG